ncbi:MAG: glycosyltransferase [Synergistaceae bacterium]|jgi:glycosyltransferase involved in cell wall biosynthesis|nr:glycosyltransferase [Synergistaceae bacterium]
MNSPMPEITVVISLYNKARCVKSTVDTVLNQTVNNFELIVVDDGSTDGSEKIVAEIADSRIKIIHQENAGVSAARNRGAAEASSDFIAFLDADDIWDADHLEALIALRRKFPDAGLYVTDHTESFYKFSNIARQRGIKLETQMLLDFFRSSVLFNHFPVHTSCFAVKKSTMLEVGGYNRAFNAFEDQEFYSRVAFKYPMTAFTLNGLSHYIAKYSELAKANVADVSEAALEKNAQYISNDIHDNTSSNNGSFFIFVRPYLHSSPDLIAFAWIFQFTIAMRLISNGKKREAILYLIRCYRFYKRIPRDKLFFIKKICWCLCACLVPKIFMTPLKKLKISISEILYNVKLSGAER